KKKKKKKSLNKKNLAFNKTQKGETGLMRFLHLEPNGCRKKKREEKGIKTRPKQTRAGGGVSWMFGWTDLANMPFNRLFDGFWEKRYALDYETTFHPFFSTQ